MWEKGMKKKKLFLGLGSGIGFLVILGLFLMFLLQPGEKIPGGQTAHEGIDNGTTLPPPTENVFTPKDFAYDGDYLTCLTDESVLGIDVSRYQGKIDWQKVKDAGFEFVMIRLGYRGYGAGALNEDAMAQENYRGAKEAGLKVGAYFFSQAISVEEAKEEAQYAMQIAQEWELEMPLVYDWECLADDYRTVGVDARLLTDCTIAFCDTVKTAGYTPMVYFNPNQSRKQMYLAELTDYDFWLAMYSDQMDYPYKVDMWQYTNQGSVPGISGNVDINLFFPYDDA
jgi:GH25 family lysozyme M1 (1,4-beta-N-acetylmuramidase)